MSETLCRRFGGLIVGVALVGCGPSTPPPPEAATGATERPPAAADVAVVRPDVGADGLVPIGGGWYRLEPDRGGFSIELPGKPEHTAKRVGDLTHVQPEMLQWSVLKETSETSVGGYVVAVSPLVKQLVDHGNVDLALDRIVEGQTSGPGKRLISRKELVRGPYKGRAMVFEAEVGPGVTAEIEARVYIVGYRMIMMTAAATGGEPHASDARRVAASFQIALDAARHGAGEALDTWRAYGPKDKSFTVSLPKEPLVERRSLATAWGEREVEIHSVMHSFPDAVYGIRGIPLTAAERAQGPDALLAAWQRFETSPEENRGSATVLTRTPTKVGAHPALRLTVRVPDPAAPNDKSIVGHHLGVVAGAVFWDVGFAPFEADAGAREAARFLDSFAPQ